MNVDLKRIYKQQKETLTLVAAARGAELDPATAAELRHLRATNRRQAQELEIFKKAIISCLLQVQALADRDPMSRYRFIEAQRGHYPVRLLCHLVQVPASGYYAWQQAQQQVVNQLESAWETAFIKGFLLQRGEKLR